MNEGADSSGCSPSSGCQPCLKQGENLGTGDVQSFHLHNPKGAPTLHFPGCPVIISSCCPDHQWALQGEHSRFLLLHDTDAAKPVPCARTWQIGKPSTPALCTQKTLKASHIQDFHRQQILSLDLFHLACSINSTAGRRKGRVTGGRAASTSQAPGPGRSGTELGIWAARP